MSLKRLSLNTSRTIIYIINKTVIKTISYYDAEGFIANVDSCPFLDACELSATRFLRLFSLI